jgi:hypothetical protein
MAKRPLPARLHILTAYAALITALGVVSSAKQRN